MAQSIPLTKGQFALVDDADFVWLNLWRWRLSSKGYAVRSYCMVEKPLYGFSGIVPRLAS